ncbi:hypothetical protein ACFLQL_01770 [Verrucomicrobiota bacterium]
MSHHRHRSKHRHHSNHSHHTSSSHNDTTRTSGRKWHKDRRLWLWVILMLVAMAAYVLTLDETIMPRLFGN